MKEKNAREQIVIYRSKNKDIELDVTVRDETVWLTQAQMSKLFDRERSVITKHINNVFRERELIEKSNVQNMHIAFSDKPVKKYSLDVVISIGYRIKSLEGTRFRQWATQILKEHILKGYTLNRNRIEKNYTQFIRAIEEIKHILPQELIGKDSILELINLFADTWVSLDAYDRDELIIEGTTQSKIKLTADKLNKALKLLKQRLIKKGEATEIFGVVHSKNSIEGIVGNIMQSFDNNELYPSVEEKAAHLIYFIIKNHPFIDGNKRSGAYAFIWFLEQERILDITRITPAALTALTLLIAESNPRDKDKIIGLICSVLNKRREEKA